MNHFWEHLMIDIYKANPNKIKPEDNFKELLWKIVSVCNMNKLWEMVSYVVDELENSERDFWWITSIQVVKESHISVHSFENVNFVSMDVYTCKQLPTFEIIDIIKNYFNTNDVEIRLIKRWLRYKKQLDEYLSSKKN